METTQQTPLTAGPLDALTIDEPNKQFWTLQISAWLGYYLVVFLAVIHPQMNEAAFNFHGQLLNLGVETISGFLLSCSQWFMLRKIVHYPLRSTLFYSFAMAAILGCVFNVIKLASYKTIIFDQVWYENLNSLEFGGWLLFSLTTLFVFNAIYFIILYNNRLQREHGMLLRAQTATKEAQLQMLRYQLNPHFMFNTLNAVSTLIYKSENEKANEMLDKLCSFFRYSLMSKNEHQSTLQDELTLIELYLSIEKVRFEKRLQAEFKVAPDTLSAKVPNLFLQPIVENAIKYGIEGRKTPGKLLISARKEGGKLKLEVVNDSADQVSEKNLAASQGFGIGLSNTQERLNTMFNNACVVSLNQDDKEGTKVSLSMPFVEGASSEK